MTEDGMTGERSDLHHDLDHPLVHVYGQYREHGDATIRGNRRGLRALRDALDEVLGLRAGHTTTEVFAVDGEGYGLNVQLVNLRASMGNVEYLYLQAMEAERREYDREVRFHRIRPPREAPEEKHMQGIVDLEGLGLAELDADDAVATVTELGFAEITTGGSGHFARIFVHPRYPSLAIRLSRTMDGWFSYGLGILTGDLDDTRYAPRVHDVALIRGGGYVALVERLRGPESHEEEELVKAISEVISDPVLADTRSVADVPGLGAFSVDVMAYLGRSYLDPKHGNVLFSLDGRPVVNDPCGRVLDNACREWTDRIRRRGVEVYQSGATARSTVAD